MLYLKTLLAKAYVVRADAYENMRKYSDAIKDYKAALKLSPESYDLMLEIAENYKWLNQFSKAKYWANKTLSKKPGYGKALIALGEIYEAAVPYCQKKSGKKSSTVEDKLVYEQAFNVYKKALYDVAFKSKARQKMNYVKPLLPTKEDRFMHPNAKIKSACYKFVK